MIYVQALVALLPVLIKIISLFIKTPAEKREALLMSFNQAIKKAEDEKDPSDLSRLINS